MFTTLSYNASKHVSLHKILNIYIKLKQLLKKKINHFHNPNFSPRRSDICNVICSRVNS